MQQLMVKQIDKFQIASELRTEHGKRIEVVYYDMGDASNSLFDNPYVCTGLLNSEAEAKTVVFGIRNLRNILNL